MKKLFKTKYFRLFILLVILGIILNLGYRKFKIQGESMVFTYGDGETLLVDKTVYKFIKPERGDVIVFYDFAEDDFLIKRVIGLPGEKVQVIEGDIYIDGYLWVDEFSRVKIAKLLVGPENKPLKNWVTGENVYENDNMEFPILGPDEYWVIGDNREESWYGVVYENEIIGKAKH